MANAVTLPGERLAGLSADLFHKLQAGSLTLDELALFMQRKNPFESVAKAFPDIFHLTVDYGQPLEQMIAAGRYDWTNSDITPKRFPVDGEGTALFEARYFHFDRDISSETVIAEIEKAGWEPAKTEHLLSHGKTFPEEQRRYPIVGLGSVAEGDGRRSVPCLCEDFSERELYLRWFDGGWYPVCRFLAVRKVSAP